MSRLPFGELAPFRARRFVPKIVDLGDWKQIEPLFDRLDTMASESRTVEALEAWILAWGELSAAIDEESSRRHIAMTCNTEDAGIEQAYLHFVESVEPELKPRQHHRDDR